jgi:hypothetical protein
LAAGASARRECVSRPAVPVARSDRAAIPAAPGVDAGRLHRLRRHMVRHAAVYQGVRRRPAAGLTC